MMRRALDPGHTTSTIILVVQAKRWPSTYRRKQNLLLLYPPSKESAEVTAFAAKAVGKGKGKSGYKVFKMKEKRLDVDLWRIDGQNHRGSHFPVVCYTKKACRRSPDANERRRKKQLEAN